MIIVIAGIIESDGKILIARRKKGKKLEGRWEFPGGKIEQNEKAEDCLKREIKEELNIEIDVFDKIAESEYKYEFGLFKVLAFHARYLNGDIQLNDHDEIKWIELKDLSNYNFVEADISIIQQIKNDK